MSLQFKYEKTCLINKSELSKELYKPTMGHTTELILGAVSRKS